MCASARQVSTRLCEYPPSGICCPCASDPPCGGPLQPRRRHGNERHGAHRKRLRVYEGKRVDSTRLH